MMTLKSGDKYRIEKWEFELLRWDRIFQLNECKTGQIMISMGKKAFMRFLKLTGAVKEKR